MGALLLCWKGVRVGGLGLAAPPACNAAAAAAAATTGMM